MPDDTDQESPDQSRSLTERVFGRVVGSVVSPVVDNVDVDEVVERIDVNHVVERLDVDDLVDRVDVDRLIARVDIDAVLGRVDVNALLDRIEPDQLLDRVDADRLLDRVDVNALLDRVEPDRLLDRVDADRLLDRVDVNALLDRGDPGRLLARVDADRLLDRVDVNALLDRVEPDRLLDRVDADRLLDRVDVNALLDRVEPDRLLDRVDADRLLDRVDVNAVVDRTELGAIIARSTTGVFTQLLDVARSQVIMVDQAAQGLPARLLRGVTREVPPKPSGPSDVSDLQTMTLSQRAIALQRHAAGSVSRFLAFVLDQFLIGMLFAAGLVLISGAVRVILGTELDTGGDRAWVAVAYGLWVYVYIAGSLAATGRTIGKAVLGLLVVSSDGSRVRGRQASLRTIAFPLSFLLFGIGFLLGLIRRDRRELHDLIARTSVIYAWDATTAQLRGSG